MRRAFKWKRAGTDPPKGRGPLGDVRLETK
jgi:hypothetical protein